MALDSVHPEYADRIEDWRTMRHVYAGERIVKLQRTTYLPATKGMQLDGMGEGQLGKECYDAYLTRAVFYDYVREAVERYLGLMHCNPAEIKLPEAMQPLLKRSTLYGEPLQLLLCRITEQQLVTGRLGLLVDLPVNPDQANPLPYIALYIAEAIKNWDANQIGEGIAKPNLVVLDESGYSRINDFEWQVVSKYRVLQIVDGKYLQGVFIGKGVAPLFVPSDMRAPVLRNKTLDEIPFVFVNTKDSAPETDNSPLMGLARTALAIYRGDADYRQNLFMQGQDTLVVSGDRKKLVTDPTGTQPVRTGAGSMIELEQGGDAKYVGVNSQGLPEQRSALEADHNRAANRSGILIDSGKSGDRSSGDAYEQQRTGQTASLHQIAWTGAAALENALKKIAIWMGQDPEQVKVIPNVEFSDFQITGDDLAKLMTARTMGLPLSRKSIHENLREKGMTKMSYDDEISQIEQEDAEDARLRGVGDLDEEELAIKKIAASKPAPKPGA